MPSVTMSVAMRDPAADDLRADADGEKGPLPVRLVPRDTSTIVPRPSHDKTVVSPMERISHDQASRSSSDRLSYEQTSSTPHNGASTDRAQMMLNQGQALDTRMSAAKSVDGYPPNVVKDGVRSPKAPNGHIAGSSYILSASAPRKASVTAINTDVSSDGIRTDAGTMSGFEDGPEVLNSASKTPDEYKAAAKLPRSPPMKPNGAAAKPLSTPNSPDQLLTPAALMSPTRQRRAHSASNSDAPNTARLGLELIPTVSNRLSSPPYDAASNLKPTTPTTPQPPWRLQHRHTLQLPKASLHGIARDLSLSGQDDAISTAVNPANGLRRTSLNLVRRTTRPGHSESYLADIPQDADAARWAQKIHEKRMSRRRRKEEEEDDRVMVGTKVDQNHVNWVTAYNMLTGIRFTVSRTNAKLDRDLTDADFEARHKFSFDITGNELTPSAKYDFKFKDYAPWVFRHLRARFHLDPADYLISLTSKYILSELGSPGKSGSFFYFSRDYKYIIKTIHHAEHKMLRKILKEYYNHAIENPNTLISQFYGLHRVKIPYGRKIHFVVMNNLFPPHRDIHQTFDLKGSTIGRDFREDELEKNPRATLKDLNWIRRDNHLELGPEKKQAFVEQMRRDVALLQRLHIMDYSLLVGIHDVGKGNEENLRDKTLRVFEPGGDRNEEALQQDGTGLQRTPSKQEKARKARELRQAIKRERPVPMEKGALGMPDDLLDTKKNFFFYSDDGGFRATHEDGSPGDEIYYLGIIDCLTHYGFVKRIENFIKGMRNNEAQISAVPPYLYGERFVKFISSVTMTHEEAERQRSVMQDRQATGSVIKHPGMGARQSSQDQVLEEAQREAMRSQSHDGVSEEDLPERTITTSQTATADRNGAGSTNVTLPVLEEVGEAASVGGRSGASRHSSRANLQESGEPSSRPPRSPLAALPATAHAEQQQQQQQPQQQPTLSPPLGGRPPPTPPQDTSREAAPVLPAMRSLGSPISFELDGA